MTETTSTLLVPGVDDCFGLCPECVAAGIYGAKQTWRNVGRENYVCCDEHNVFWCLGSNIISSWRDESEELWQQNSAELETMRRVEPRFLPKSEVAAKQRALRERQVNDLFFFLDEKQQEIVLALLSELSGMEITEHGLISRPRDPFMASLLDG